MADIKQLEQIFRTTFQEQPDLTTLRQFHANNAYCLNEEGEITGLCFCENDVDAINIPRDIPTLRKVRYLNLSDNPSLKQLQIETALPALEHLDLSDSGLEELKLPAGYKNLQWLDLSRNKLEKVEFAGRLPELNYLDLTGNKLSSLSLNAWKLEYLYLNDNELEELEFTAIPDTLRVLQLKNNKLERLPGNFLSLTGLQLLYLDGNPLSSIPKELIPSDESDNALDAVLDYLRELGGGTIVNDRARLIIVGNGRVGKTSIYRRLANQPYNEKEPYTHGIQIGQLEKEHLPGVKTGSLQLKVWDFGGQEIFYGTHQFFLSDEAIYLLAWTDEKNVISYREREMEELPFDGRWRSCEYWLENIRLHGEKSPVVMVQTHADKWQNISSFDPSWKENFNAFAINFSAAKDFGLPELKDVLCNRLNSAIPMLGQEFPESYDKMINSIEELKQSQAFISFDKYLELAGKAGIQEGGEKTLLDYLIKTGVVVHFDKKLLKEVIYINPDWLTKQVYRLINNELRSRNGRIDQTYLKYILPPPTYDEKQREQFVELLKSFELVFQPEGVPYLIAPQYLPEALGPDAQQLYNDIFDDLSLGFVFRFPKFMPDNVMINFLSRYGPYSSNIFYKSGLYFKDRQKAKCIVRYEEANNSLYVYTGINEAGRDLQREVCHAFVELSKNANAEISLDGSVFASWQELEKHSELYAHNPEQQLFAIDGTPLYIKDFVWLWGKERSPYLRINDLKAQIRDLVGKSKLEAAIKVLAEEQLDSAVQLQQRLKAMNKQLNEGVVGFDRYNTERNKISRAILDSIKYLDLQKQEPPKRETVKENKPVLGEKIYFSYAWGDEATGDRLVKLVNQMYTSLLSEGFNVLRDAMDVEYGGLISQFMKELGTGDLIVVFVSDNYAKSPYCMFELFEIARNSNWDKELFRSRILPIPLERIRFDQPEVIDHYFDHWEKEEKRWEELIKKRFSQTSEAQHQRYIKTRKINQSFGQLSDWLVDINASTTKLLSENDFQMIKEAIKNRISQMKNNR